jgi:hypothetical protein
MRGLRRKKNAAVRRKKRNGVWKKKRAFQRSARLQPSASSKRMRAVCSTTIRAAVPKTMCGAASRPKTVRRRLRLVLRVPVRRVTVDPGLPAVRRDLAVLVHVPPVQARLRAAGLHRQRGRLRAAPVPACKRGVVAMTMMAVRAGVPALAGLVPVRSRRRRRVRSRMTDGVQSLAW